jgi:26S proteasome regulatory subunit N5
MIQHNIRVIERYYSRIKLERLSILVGVSVERTEAELGDMVVKKRIAAKINRLEGIVVFSKKKQFTNGKLTEWNHNIKETLDKIETTCHLINREKIIHQRAD